MERPVRNTQSSEESLTPTTGRQGPVPGVEGAPAPVVPPVEDRRGPMTIEQRRELFARTLRMDVARGGRIGGRIESQADLPAVVVHGHTKHGLHLILSIVTGGVWAIFVWLPLVVLRRKRRQFINIDEFGVVTIQPSEGELAAQISGVLGAPQVAGAFVNPKGLTKSAAIGEAGNQVGGVFGVVGSAITGFLTNLALEIFPKRRAHKEYEDHSSNVAHDATPLFDTIAYLAVSADDVLLVQANTDMARWVKLGPEVMGRVPRSAVAFAELDLGHWLSTLRIESADDGWWQFEVRRKHRDTAEQVARALGGRVG
jgi:hypothetical protein